MVLTSTFSRAVGVKDQSELKRAGEKRNGCTDAFNSVKGVNFVRVF